MSIRITIWTLILALSLSACTDSPAPQPTATASDPSQTPVIEAAPSEPPTPTPNPEPTPTAQSNCTDSALFIADITIPDETNLPAGQPFSKTWRLRNSGTCTWNSGYTLNFISGEPMESPGPIPFEETRPGEEFDISVELTAPNSDGNFAAFYEIRSPTGKTVPVGLLTNIWVKIRVGAFASAPPATAASPANPVVNSTPLVCNPSSENGAANQIISLINTARAENGLPALSQNEKLDSAARRQSVDMICNNLRGHTGSDGSSIAQRVAEAGYASSFSEEIIYVGGGAEAAFAWWMNDTVHREAILRSGHTHIGVSVSYQPGSAFGTSISVVMASP